MSRCLDCFYYKKMTCKKFTANPLEVHKCEDFRPTIELLLNKYMKGTKNV